MQDASVTETIQTAPEGDFAEQNEPSETPDDNVHRPSLLVHTSYECVPYTDRNLLMQSLCVPVSFTCLGEDNAVAYKHLDCCSHMDSNRFWVHSVCLQPFYFIICWQAPCIKMIAIVSAKAFKLIVWCANSIFAFKLFPSFLGALSKDFWQAWQSYVHLFHASLQRHLNLSEGEGLTPKGRIQELKKEGKTPWKTPPPVFSDPQTPLTAVPATGWQDHCREEGLPLQNRWFSSKYAHSFLYEYFPGMQTSSGNWTCH